MIRASILVRNFEDGFRAIVRGSQFQTLFTTEKQMLRSEAYRIANEWLQAKNAETATTNAAKKAARELATMTCQCCARKHLANKGVIAHHGFERPGSGWQTASCYGARHLPFEVDRAVLGMMITALRNRKAVMIETRGKAEREEIDFLLYYSDYSVKANAYGKRPEVTVKVTRATWDTMKTEHADGFRRSIHHHDFDSVKTADLADRDHSIERITRDINECQRRYDGWKQTHVWNNINETWIRTSLSTD